MKQYWMFEFNYFERQREREAVVKERHFVFFTMT